MKCYVCKNANGGFVRNRDKPSGFSNICKSCSADKSRARRLAHRIPRKTKSAFEKFLIRIVPPKSLYDCWVWSGHSTRFGYGKFRSDKTVYAHRYSYEKFVSQIPRGLHIDHLCSRPSCVNPIHLEPVTQAENNRRSRQRKKYGNIASKNT